MAAPGSDGFQHVALLYHSQAEYLREVAVFVQAALARGEPALLAVPGSRIGPLRDALGADAQDVGFADMTRVGRNPGGIISVIRSFAEDHRGRRASYVGEPAWPARSASEFLEAAKHEALINLAFAGTPLTVLCPYDAAGLPPGVLTAAGQTHPLLTRGGQPIASQDYLGAGGIPLPCLQPLPPPPLTAEILHYRTDLRPLRDLAGRAAARPTAPPPACT